MKTDDYIEKPWGWERILDLSDRYVVKHLSINLNCRLSLQYHERKRETLFLISSTAELTLRGPDGIDRDIQIEGNHPYVIEPGMVLRLHGADAAGALLMEVSTPGLDDVVRIEDDYGRA